jgi:Putative MetA-pathway of phenol degradation
MFDRLKVTAFDPSAPLAPLFAGTVSERSGFGDVTVGAKIRFLSETIKRPAIAVRFATRLPFLDLDTGVGAQTTDFIAGVALGKTVRSLRMVANTGIGILGDPVRGDRQNQVFTYGGSVARAVATGAEIVAELNGRLDLGSDLPPLGTENRLGIRVGGRFTHGPVRIDAAFIIGANEGDSPWGLTFGATWVFKAFELK